MKTAMQQLIEWIEQKETGKVPVVLTSVEIHKKALDLLFVERQQIEDAHNSELIKDYDDRFCINDLTIDGNGCIYYALKYEQK